MKKVITYGTYDLLHYGHIRLLERAKALGDYLIVGVTSDDFDKTRGKINVQQTLEERVQAVRNTGLADKIIIEEYEGQKIDDIKKYGIDIFTVGSDWVGYFDYLNEFCKVVYLPRTEGVSSSEIRDQKRSIRIGLVGYAAYLNRVYAESKAVNGANVTSLCSENTSQLKEDVLSNLTVTNDYELFLNDIDAVYIHSNPIDHYEEIKKALEAGKHVLCESPIALKRDQVDELGALADSKNCILMESLRTAYSTAYARMLLLIKGGKIGEVVSVDAALLPVFQLLGTNFKDISITSRCGIDKSMDEFSGINLIYDHAMANIKVGTGAKSEGDLIISGTKGYVYVPAPWWKMDYFEIRYENPAENKRYFYQLDGEGIRYELVAFLKMIDIAGDRDSPRYMNNIDITVTKAICGVMEQFTTGMNVKYI